ncbi:putative disease resistance RPP13-like protein 1 isoform X2 [Pistacia vera]|uniref:putative disease resistance RPP13-like protein 1 isoform X2 n=1 Tax=Pistacia vera TaxID=55513 RepID=UPI0012639681|nr:putative disease resistance RPP13-like protein 1 isoform X2 [Pistacia vera]
MHAFDRWYIDLQLIREKVIPMCKGLPLAASILGGLISCKRDDEWECVLNTKLWDLADDNEILPVLKLSYQHLPLWLQRCFVYCAILPDGYEFEEKELVLLWIAEGLIGGAQEDEQMVCEQLEDRGCKIFQNLLERSLFENSSSHASKYRTHDLVKTMARWIHGETNFRLEDVSGVNERPECANKNKFDSFYDVDNLRTFMPGLLCNDGSHHITDALLSDLLPKFKRLRALSLAKHSITKLPSSVEGLRYLRYVNLSSTMIRTLPDSICSLPILQILLLRDCSHLVELPSNLRKLINLWYLDITGVNLLREMPLGMKELTCLRTLLNFIVGKGVGSDLKDLEDLKFLGELYVSRLQNATSSQDTKDSILKDKKDLKVLVLEWGSQLNDTRDELVEENVLANLQPHQNLREFTIRGYGGARFSSWVGDPMYSNLVVLTLERCEKCTVLPLLGLLSSLEHLTIKGMTGIKRIGSELFGKDCSRPFKSLKTLCFEDFQEWERWDSVAENEHVIVFPCLRELSLVKCPKLRAKLPEHHLRSLKKLRIRECELLDVSFTRLPLFCHAEVDGCKMECGEEFVYTDRVLLRRIHRDIEPTDGCNIS